MAYNDEVGSKYAATKTLSHVQVAKLIRADLKSAQKDGSLPKGLKFSVRCQNSSIRIEIQNAGFRILTARGLGDYTQPGVLHTPEATKVDRTVTNIANAYSFDHSDIQTDYFHVRFYLHVDYNWDDVKLERQVAEELAAIPAKNVISFNRKAV